MNRQPHNRRDGRRGFTLIELTLVISIGAIIAALLLALFNQQLAFLRIFRAQGFLNEEAPVVSMHVARIIGRADRFRLHASVSDAMENTNARLTDSPVLLMNFRQPDGTMRAGMLAFETRDGRQALYYHLVPEDGALPQPQWFITDRATDVRFSLEEGVLRMRLTGPAGEQIIYSGTMQQ